MSKLLFKCTFFYDSYRRVSNFLISILSLFGFKFLGKYDCQVKKYKKRTAVTKYNFMGVPKHEATTVLPMLKHTKKK